MSGRIRIGLIVGGIIALVYANTQRRLGSGYEPEARVLTPKELIASDPDGNRHVKLTNLKLDLDESVYVYYERNGKEDWDSTYLPVSTGRGKYDLQIIVTTKSIKSGQDLERFGDRTEVEGMIVTGVDSLDTDAQKLLRQTFPQADFDNLWLLDADKTEPGSPWPPALLGIVLLGIGVKPSRS